jgi:hypothetical protein
MGRHISGDIDYKFAYGIQSSDAANRFGVFGEQNYLSYYYDKSDLQGVIDELNRIKEDLGDDFDKLKAFFDKAETYSDKDIENLLGVEKDKASEILSEYFDYELGEKIKECIEKNGSCSFDAEL